MRHVPKGRDMVCVYQFLKPVLKDEEVLGDYGNDWRGLADWARNINSSIDEEEEREWRSFLGRGLYNLERLKRPKEKDA